MAALALWAPHFVEQRVPDTWRMMHGFGARREHAERYGAKISAPSMARKGDDI